MRSRRTSPSSSGTFTARSSGWSEDVVLDEVLFEDLGVIESQGRQAELLADPSRVVAHAPEVAGGQLSLGGRLEKRRVFTGDAERGRVILQFRELAAGCPRPLGQPLALP